MAGSNDGFAEKVRDILKDPQNLPPELSDWIIQKLTLNPVQVAIDRAPGFQSTGLTGSIAASRYVGATTSGAPASGYHLVGDFVIDQTGTIWICTAAGSPGTWTKITALLHFQDDGTLVGTEGTADFEDSSSLVWTVTDDPANGRVKISAEVPSTGITNETFFVPANSSSGTLSSGTLKSGVTYTVVVEGTYTEVNHALDVGSPESDAMFPTSTAGRTSTTVGIDADTQFAYWSGGSGFIGHATNFEISLDGGSTYAHLEPAGGPYSSPASGHLYRYALVGQGHVAGFLISDSPGQYSDNYGELKVTIQAPDGTGSGSGAGSLVPTGGTDYQVLESLSGVPTWANIDGGSA